MSEQGRARARQIGEEARGIAGHCTTYVGGQQLIAKLDDNPFVPLQIGKTLGAALSKVIA